MRESRSVTPGRDHRRMDQQVRLPLGEEKAPAAPIAKPQTPGCPSWHIDEQDEAGRTQGSRGRPPCALNTHGALPTLPESGRPAARSSGSNVSDA